MRATHAVVVFPEGPIAADDVGYFNTEGETQYLAAIARSCGRPMLLAAYCVRPGSKWYSSIARVPIDESLIEVLELPLAADHRPGILPKIVQMCRVWSTIWANRHRWSFLYLFIPGYPSLLAYIINLFDKKPYAVYAASDWSAEEAGLIFRWRGWRRRLFLGPVARISELAERHLVRHARFVLVASRECLTRYAPLNDRVEKTVPRINWTGLVRTYRTDTLDQGRPVTLLCVGNLYARKGISVLLEAVAHLRVKTDVRLLLVGDGEGRSAFEQESRDLGIESHVTFLGHVSNGVELYRYYREADVFVLPSLGEGFPRVLYEAMASSLPIVTTSVGGISAEMADGPRAVLVEPGNALALVRGVERVIDDTQLRRALIANGQSFMDDILRNSDGGRQFQRLQTAGGPIR